MRIFTFLYAYFEKVWKSTNFFRTNSLCFWTFGSGFWEIKWAPRVCESKMIVVQHALASRNIKVEKSNSAEHDFWIFFPAGEMLLSLPLQSPAGEKVTFLPLEKSIQKYFTILIFASRYRLRRHILVRIQIEVGGIRIFYLNLKKVFFGQKMQFVCF